MRRRIYEGRGLSAGEDLWISASNLNYCAEQLQNLTSLLNKTFDRNQYKLNDMLSEDELREASDFLHEKMDEIDNLRKETLAGIRYIYDMCKRG